MQDWVPADVTSAVKLRVEQHMFAKAPGPLYFFALRGKEQPWREAVAEERHGSREREGAIIERGRERQRERER